MPNMFDGHFEPLANKVGEALPDTISTAVLAQISAAISLKRQADAAERIAAALEVLNQQDIFHPEFGLNSAIWKVAKNG